MKQLIQAITALFLLLECLQVNAQEIKLKGGLNYSSVTFYNTGKRLSDEFDSRLGYQFGANAVVPVSANYSINTGVIMMKRKHDRINIPEPNDKWHFTTTRWYLEFPVLARREFRLNKVSLYGELGPYVGVGVGQTIDNPYKYYYKGEFVQKGNIDYQWGADDYDLKRVDFGYNIGLGFLINKWEVGICYEHGIINFENASWLESKNRAILFNCAYKLFSFKKQN